MKLFIAALLSLAMAAGATAADFPVKPIRIVFPGAPGGSLEGLVRIIGEELTRQLGQPVVVDPKPGGGTTIAARLVAAAPADGYTLLMTSVGVVGPSPYLYKNLPYDVIRDFAPIARISTSPNAIVVGSKVPVKDMSQFIAYAKAHPGQINAGSVGLGTTSHLVGVAAYNAANIKVTNVTFKGSPEMTVAIIRGDVQVASQDLGGFLTHVNQGTMRALAVTGPTRSPKLPDVPTLQELGMPQADLHIWYGLVAPAGTPADVLKKIADAVGVALADPKVAARYEAFGGVPAFLPLGPFGEFMKSEYARFKPIVDASGYRGEN